MLGINIGSWKKERGRSPESHVEGAKGEVDPASGKEDPTVPGALQKIGPQQLLKLRQDFRVGRGVQTVTSVVRPEPL